MSTTPYLFISGFIFFVVGLLHLMRILCHWPAQIGTWFLPVWVSYLGLIAAWGLCVWAYRLSRR